MNNRSVDMLFVRCKQELPYCRRLKFAISANTEMTKEDLEPQCWLFDEPYTNMYLICGGTHRTRAVGIGTRHRVAVRYPIFVRWNNLTMFAVPRLNRYQYYVSVSAFWQNLEAPCIMCIPPHPIFAYYFRAFGETARLFGYLLLETAMTEFTIMYFVCFMQSVEYGTANLFLLARFQGLCEDSRVCVNQVLHALSLFEMRASALKRGVCTILATVS